MKKMNKKGFTIVELVIVIAVIAILAAVMIPTFGGIIKKANDSAVKQEVAAAYKEAYALAIADGVIENGATTGETVTVGNFTFTFKGDLDNITGTGAVADDAEDYTKANGYTFTIEKGQLVVTEP